jgi:hypothetical protein
MVFMFHRHALGLQVARKNEGNIGLRILRVTMIQTAIRRVIAAVTKAIAINFHHTATRNLIRTTPTKSRLAIPCKSDTVKITLKTSW